MRKQPSHIYKYITQILQHQTMSKELDIVKKYQITIRKVSGKIVVTYEKGFLSSIEGLGNIAVKKGKQSVGFPALAWRLADFQYMIPRLHQDIRVEDVRTPKVNQKIALWCTFFKKYQGYPYKIKQKEINLMRGLTVSEELLKAYFEHKSFPVEIKNVANYSQHFNHVVGLMTGAVKPKEEKSKYPDDWSKQIEARYQGVELQEYWAFLRSKGWERILTNSGVRKWTRKANKEEVEQ